MYNGRHEWTKASDGTSEVCVNCGCAHTESRDEHGVGERCLAEPSSHICKDCENEFNDNEGKPYKYEPSIWLCDDCDAERMEEDNSPQCEKCGTTEAVSKSLNPYTHDMHGDDTLYNLCPECHADLLGDI